MNPDMKRLLAAHAEEEDDGDAAILSCVSHLLLANRPPPRKKKRGGSRPGKAANIDRDHAGGHQPLWRDYFMSNPVYSAKLFRRRFRMSRRLFHKVLNAVVSQDPYFVQRPDATGKVGLSSHQKVTAALRMFCYGTAADSLDEYLRISDTVATDCLRHFSDAVIACFGDEFLRQPTAADIHRHTSINKARGFPGMFGSWIAPIGSGKTARTA
jgi:hypothetical protein